jgi:chemotaxis protein histidine kinase CheA
VWLAAALGREAPPAEGGSWPAVLVQGHDGEFALLVERIVEARELMLRPLDPLLQRLPLLAGAAVQGEGEVLWVLDLAAIEVPPLPA